jgi:hypothetical protein
MLTLDMGTYGERNSVTALIGAPPGYIGYDDGGKLTEFARRHPSSIVLLDKIDRASEQVRDLIAAAISGGQIIDAKGRKVSFRNVIVIVARDVEVGNRSFGFHSSAEKANSAGLPGMQFDRTFRIALADENAADAMIAARLSATVQSYLAAGTRMEISPDVPKAIAARGRESGGRGGDYLAAYAEIFESELFRSAIPKRGTMNVRMQGRRLVVETENTNEVAA